MASDDLSRLTTDGDSESEALASIALPLELAKLAAIGSRFFNGLAEIEIFSEGEVDLTDWVALSLIADSETVTSSQLCRSMGVSRERIASITDLFHAAGLVSVTPSVRDSRLLILSITDAGRAKLEGVNAKVQVLLSDALGPRGRLVPNAAKHFVVLMKVLMANRTADSAEA
jgi:DNA-binding MarR family transcriptional regulator